MIIKNLIKVLKSKVSLFWVFFWMLLIAIPTYYFLDSQIIIWNKWYTYYYFEMSLDFLIMLLFWIFLWATLYKMTYFSTWKTWVWFLWWFLGILVSGCPSCTITLASYFWLAWIVSVLPFWWIELKVISVLILLYVCYSTLKNLEVCNLKIKK